MTTRSRRWVRVTLTLATALTAALAGMVLAGPPASANTAALHTSYNGKCVDADLNTINRNGTRIQLWDCNGSPQQTWNFAGDGTIRVGRNNKCLDSDTNTAGRLGAVVQLWDCNGSAAQRWSVINGVIRSGYSGQCLDADLNAIAANGARVQLWSCNGSKQQQWYGLYNGVQNSACGEYTGGTIWSTSNTYARVRAQVCFVFDRGIVRPYANVQIDWPTSCSVGLPPSAGCSLGELHKIKQLSVYELHLRLTWSDPTGAGSEQACQVGAFTTTWPKDSSRTYTCEGGWMPLRFRGDYRVSAIGIEADVKNDGQGWRSTGNAEWSRYFAL
ncbi:ricin-type beta-trefoil lectin domain protein [Dactylosporangium sp. CA-092794]|uniref:ricin-type beta-trefoil lectin domain protein n=1 Tax=Dactylosporangium sp. CA-092794 TaxID=3239929 RepID=UPI003D929353